MDYQVKREHFFWLFLLAILSILINHYFITKSNITQNLLNIDPRNQTQNIQIKRLSEAALHFIRNLIAKFNSSTHLTKRFSINGPTIGGYGNQIYAMLTALTISVLIDAEFICLWPNIDKYIEEPFKSSFRNKTSFNITAIANMSEVYRPRMMSAWNIQKDMKLVVKSRIPEQFAYIYYAEFNAYFFELCSNPIYYDKLLQFNLVKTDTIKEARAVLESNIDNSEQLHNSLFRIGFEVGGNLLNRHWRPKKYLLAQVEQLYENKFTGNYVIGMQIRTHYLDVEKDVNVFIKCAIQLENAYLKMNGSKLTKWFLSSDSELVVRNLSASFPDKILLGEGLIAHVVENNKGYDRTIIDSELLSRTDNLIITGGSTFGFVAAMKRQELGYFVNGKGSMNDCQKVTFSRTGSTGNNFTNGAAAFR